MDQIPQQWSPFLPSKRVLNMLVVSLGFFQYPPYKTLNSHFCHGCPWGMGYALCKVHSLCISQIFSGWFTCPTANGACQACQNILRPITIYSSSTQVLIVKVKKNVWFQHSWFFKFREFYVLFVQTSPFPFFTTAE